MIARCILPVLGGCVCISDGTRIQITGNDLNVKFLDNSGQEKSITGDQIILLVEENKPVNSIQPSRVSADNASGSYTVRRPNSHIEYIDPKKVQNPKRIEELAKECLRKGKSCQNFSKELAEIKELFPANNDQLAEMIGVTGPTIGNWLDPSRKAQRAGYMIDKLEKITGWLRKNELLNGQN